MKDVTPAARRKTLASLLKQVEAQAELTEDSRAETAIQLLCTCIEQLAEQVEALEASIESKRREIMGMVYEQGCGR